MVHDAKEPRITQETLELGGGRTVIFKLTVYPAYRSKPKHSREGRIRTCRKKVRLDPRLSVIYRFRDETTKNTGKPRIYLRRFAFYLSNANDDFIFDMLSQCAHECRIHGADHAKFLDTFGALRHHAII